MKRRASKVRGRETAERSVFPVKLSADERALLKQAAGDYPVSTWARVQLLEAARKAIAEKGGRR